MVAIQKKLKINHRMVKMVHSEKYSFISIFIYTRKNIFIKQG